MKVSYLTQARREYQDISTNPEFDKLILEYIEKRSGWWKMRRAMPKKGYYMIGSHTHTDGYPLERVAEVGAARGFDIIAVTDHNEDYKFAGRRVIYYSKFNKGIFLVRGLEACCEDFELDLQGNRIGKPDRKKILLIGYDGNIESKQPLTKTIEQCKNQGGLVLATSAFNEGSRGLDQQQLEKHFDNIDAIGVLDSGYGFFGIGLTKLDVFDIKAKYFAMGNNNLKRKKATFTEANSHVLDEIGVAADYTRTENLRCLESPEAIEKNPDILIRALKNVFSTGNIEGEGFYVPSLSIFRPERLKIGLADAFESIGRRIRHGY